MLWTPLRHISYVTVAGCATPRDNELCAPRRPPGATGRHLALHHDVTRVDAAIPIRRSVHSTVLDHLVYLTALFNYT
jgi:hypothetical protein